MIQKLGKKSKLYLKIRNIFKCEIVKWSFTHKDARGCQWKKSCEGLLGWKVKRCSWGWVEQGGERQLLWMGGGAEREFALVLVVILVMIMVMILVMIIMMILKIFMIYDEDDLKKSWGLGHRMGGRDGDHFWLRTDDEQSWNVQLTMVFNWNTPKIIG